MSAADDLEVNFTVLPGSLESPVLITMTAYGSTLEELILAFSPAGLSFDPDAHLTVRIGEDLVNTPLGKIQGIHEYGDGIVEEVQTLVHQWGPWVFIDISVPGFSRYSVGRGR